MKSFVLTSLASLLACISALAATDVSGKWSSATMFVILKQEGTRISGSGGPTEKQQVLTFDNGTRRGRPHRLSRPARFNSTCNSRAMRSKAK